MESKESGIKENLIYKEGFEEKNLVNQRLENSLSLRKRKINDILSKKRGFDRFKKDGQKDYKIELEGINIPYEIKNKKYDNLDNFLKEIKKFIQSDNIEYNKYALYCLRTQTISNEGSNNKNEYAQQLQKQNFIFDILNLIQKYFDNKSIIFEGIWILINVLYYLNNNYDLVLFLSNQQCIDLYLKILDKKDNYLRFNLYWLLSNLIINNNAGLTNQVIFHLYMSPFFRMYLIKDLEDINIKLSDEELYYLISILGFLSDFISDTFERLSKNDIKNFIDYNSNANFQSIKENNNYLLAHCLQNFIKYIENPNLTCFCLLGLSKLTNFLENSEIYKKFADSEIILKLIRGQIKIEEEFLNYVVQIIGNFLNFTAETALNPLFLEETLNYFVKLLQTYPTLQLLKRDIFWSASNINEEIISSSLMIKSGLIVLALQSICSDNDFVINEALYLLLGFFYIKNIELIVNNYNLDYIKNLVLCLKNLHTKCTPGEAYKNKDIIERVLSCINSLFEMGNYLKVEGIGNKFVKDFEINGGFELLEIMLSENNFSENSLKIAELLLKFQNNNGI